MARGDYDHNHTLLSGMNTTLMVIVVIIILGVAILGGLSIGLFVLDNI